MCALLRLNRSCTQVTNLLFVQNCSYTTPLIRPLVLLQFQTNMISWSTLGTNETTMPLTNNTFQPVVNHVDLLGDFDNNSDVTTDDYELDFYMHATTDWNEEEEEYDYEPEAQFMDQEMIDAALYEEFYGDGTNDDPINIERILEDEIVRDGTNEEPVTYVDGIDVPPNFTNQWILLRPDGQALFSTEWLRWLAERSQTMDTNTAPTEDTTKSDENSTTTGLNTQP